ncbi:hypothetical protein HN011_000658 [Eciton burchellii]|nr:hypothetical protein HN011_000658 [Eciton burchellii]
MTSRTREGLRTGSNSLARRFVTRCGRRGRRESRTRPRISVEFRAFLTLMAFPTPTSASRNQKPHLGARLHRVDARPLISRILLRSKDPRENRRPARGGSRKDDWIPGRMMLHQITLAIRQIRVETDEITGSYSTRNSFADFANLRFEDSREREVKAFLLAREAKSLGEKMQYFLTGYPCRRKVLSEGYSSRRRLRASTGRKTRMESGGIKVGVKGRFITPERRRTVTRSGNSAI